MLLAEQTTAILWSFKLALEGSISFTLGSSLIDLRIAYRTMSSAIFTGNFPTLVPPNFCTTQVRVLMSCFKEFEINGEEASECPFNWISVVIVQAVCARLVTQLAQAYEYGGPILLE